MASLLNGVPASVQAAGRTDRLAAVDGLRGLIMVVMALDHANFFIARLHPLPEMWTGPFPSYSSALAFLTRLVTHLAAPGFFFLMGVGITLFADSRRRLGWSQTAIAFHLLVRGALLIVLQCLVEDPAWPIASAGRPVPLWSSGEIYVGVLYGLGACLLVSCVLYRLGSSWLIGVSLGAILITQIVFAGPIRLLAPFSLWLRLLLVPGNTGDISVYYPVIPWLGLMTFGLLFGRWLLEDRAGALRRALVIGLVCLVLFGLVRLAGGWGNIRPAQGPGWIAFFNVVKYPPSLVFIFLALGIDLILLAGLARVVNRGEFWVRPFLVFGASPLFFYIAHLYLYGLLGLVFSPAHGSLLAMYPVWLAGLAILYPLCWAYGRLKRRQAPDSVLRFF